MRRAPRFLVRHAALSSALLVVPLVAGCGRAMRWEYSMPSSFDGSAMVARVRVGSCAGTEVRYERAFTDGESAGDGPVLPEGTYGVEIEVLGTDCDVVARGCEEVTLPGGDVVHVAITPITPVAACSPDRCMDGVCVTPDAGTDAGMDAAGADDVGVTDDVPNDGPPPDVGVGDECSDSTECPCAGDTCEAGRCVPLRPASIVEAGYEHVCAIAGGRLFCWGSSGVGEVGIAWNTVAPLPTRIGAASDWTDVSSFGDHTCGIQGGAVRCWGSNYTGQCGIDPGTSENVLNGPVAIAVPITPSRIAVGSLHSFALDAAGALAGWGRNSQAQVGGSANTMSPLPPTTLPETWLDVSGGEFFSCSVDTDHRLWCRGANFDGSLGTGGGCTDCGPREVLDPTPGLAGPEWAHAELGRRHACAWDTAGALYCWGRGNGASLGALGAGEPAPASVSAPTRVPGLTVARASLGLHTCVVETTGALWCFGPNESGQLGVGDLDTRFDPARVAGSEWTDVTTGSDFTCGLRASGAIFCWGDGDAEVLGQDDGQMDHSTPARVCVP